MKVKVTFNNETHLVSRPPTLFGALCQLILSIFINKLPSEWSLTYVDSEGDKVMLSDDLDYSEFMNAHKNETMKIHIVPKTTSLTNTPSEGNSRKTSEYQQEQYSIIEEKEALKSLLIPAESAEKIVINKDKKAEWITSSVRILKSEQEISELIAKEVQKQLAELNLSVCSNDPSLTKKVEEIKKIIHEQVRCTGCGMLPIEGIRYKCVICDSFDFCEDCEANTIHSHALIKIRHPNQEYSKPVKKPSFKAPNIGRLLSPPKSVNKVKEEPKAQGKIPFECAKFKPPKFNRHVEDVIIQKPTAQNQIWGGQPKLNVENLYLLEQVKATSDKNQDQTAVREECDMSMFEDFLKWKTQTREEKAFQKDIYCECGMKNNCQNNCDQGNGGATSLLAEIRSKGTIRKTSSYKEYVSDSNSLQTIMVDKLYNMISYDNDRQKIDEEGFTNPHSSLLAEIRSGGPVRNRSSNNNDSLRWRTQRSEEIAAQKDIYCKCSMKSNCQKHSEQGNRGVASLLAEIRSKGAIRKADSYREHVTDANSLEQRKVDKLYNMISYDNDRQGIIEERITNPPSGLLAEIRAKGSIRKGPIQERLPEKKEYSEKVKNTAALIKEVMKCDWPMEKILELVANHPEAVDNMLAEYDF